MKTPPRKPTGPATSERRTVAPESKQSKETFPRRTQPPGSAGLANEARPGLGTRQNEPFPGDAKSAPKAASESLENEDNVAAKQRSSLEPNDKPLPREPQEQRPDTWAHEAERSTGVSGHSGGD